MKRFEQCHNENQLPLSEEQLPEHIERLQSRIDLLKNRLRNYMADAAAQLQNKQADELLFRHFIDANVIAMHRSDIFGNLYEANDAYLRLLGRTREELLSAGFGWRQITPPEYYTTDENAIAQIKEVGMALPWEKEYFHKDGHRVPVLVGVVAADCTGRDCIVFTLDLTNMKRIEKDLRSSEAKFRILAEAMPSIVWIAESGGRVTYANQTFYNYTGLKREDDDGWAWLETLHPDDRQPCLDEGERAAVSLTPFEMEMRYRSASGVYRWHLARALPLTDPQTNTTIWFGTCTDIDDRKRAEENLKESEARFRMIADAIPQIVWRANAAGEIDFFNHRWFEYTGLSLEQSQNGGWSLLIHPDDRDDYMSQWQQALQTGDTCEVEFRLRRAAGIKRSKTDPYRWHLARVVALRGREGQIVKWFATWTEIEDQKRKMSR